MIQTVIFDLDDTLLYPDLSCRKQLLAELHAIAPQLSVSELQAHVIAWPGNWPQSDDEEVFFWQSIFRTIAPEYSLTEPVIADLLPLLLSYHGTYRVFDDVLPSLERLHLSGLRLAVLTNSNLPNIGRSLEISGIDTKWFEVCLPSLRLGGYKPDLRPYREIMNLLNLPPDACLFVDDQLANVAAAGQLGLHAVLLDRQGAAQCLDYPCVRDLAILADRILDVPQHPIRK